MGAAADAEPIFAPAEVAAFAASTVRAFPFIGSVMGAGILHPGDKGLALCGVLGVCLKVGIDHIRRAIAVARFIIAVAQLKGAAEGFYHRVQITLFGLIGEVCMHWASFPGGTPCFVVILYGRIFPCGTT